VLINENNRMFTAFTKKQLNEEGQPTKGSTTYNGQYNTQQGGEVYSQPNQSEQWRVWLNELASNPNELASFKTKEELIQWLRTSVDTLEGQPTANAPEKGSTTYNGQYNTQPGGEVYRERQPTANAPEKGSTTYNGQYNTQPGGEVYRETIKRRRSTVYKRLDEQDNIAVGDFVTDQDGQDGIITDIEGSVVSLRELGQEGWSTDYSKLIKGDYYGTSPGKPIVGDIVTTGEGETGVLTDIDGNTASIMEVGEYGWSADFSKIRKK
jgi:hypothetical protein